MTLVFALTVPKGSGLKGEPRGVGKGEAARPKRLWRNFGHRHCWGPAHPGAHGRDPQGRGALDTPPGSGAGRTPEDPGFGVVT